MTLASAAALPALPALPALLHYGPMTNFLRLGGTRRSHGVQDCFQAFKNKPPQTRPVWLKSKRWNARGCSCGRSAHTHTHVHSRSMKTADSTSMRRKSKGMKQSDAAGRREETEVQPVDDELTHRIVFWFLFLSLKVLAKAQTSLRRRDINEASGQTHFLHRNPAASRVRSDF